jgi:GT2 family glycosyltransferase
MFSVVVDASSADGAAVTATIESLLAQAYRNVEVTICGVPRDPAIDSERESWKCRGYALRGLVWEPEAIAVHALSWAHPGSRSPAVRGDYVMCLPAGTTLDADCFLEICHAIDSCDLDVDPQLVLIDHDRTAADGGDPVPHLLWEWGIDQLLVSDLIGPSFLASRDLVEQRGGVPCASVREWMLSLMGKGPEPVVVHVPAPLVHVRTHPPTALQSVESGVATGVGLNASSAAQPPDPRVQAGVSVIIPTRNRADLLRECVGCLGRPGTSMELIIVDNGSDDPDALALLCELESHGGATVLRYPGPFNFSLLCNAGAAVARHETLLLLNNDVRIGDWTRIAHLIEYLWRDGVGVVGTTLHYPDGSVQHAGVVVRNYGAASHVMHGARVGSEGYALAHMHPRSMLAVTGALILVRREVFAALHGLDESLPVEWNDIDFCLRARHAGWRVVCVPSEGIIHDESASRSVVESEALLQMRRSACDHMMRTWHGLQLRDPFSRACVVVEGVDRPLLREPG